MNQPNPYAAPPRNDTYRDIGMTRNKFLGFHISDIVQPACSKERDCLFNKKITFTLLFAV